MDITKILLDGGSVAAVIVVVVIFLKYQTRFENKLETISKEFGLKVDSIHTNFIHQLDILAKNFLEHERIYQTQIQALITDFMQVSREMIQVTKELELAIRNLREEVIKKHKI